MSYYWDLFLNFAEEGDNILTSITDTAMSVAYPVIDFFVSDTSSKWNCCFANCMRSPSALLNDTVAAPIAALPTTSVVTKESLMAAGKISNTAGGPFTSKASYLLDRIGVISHNTKVVLRNIFKPLSIYGRKTVIVAGLFDVAHLTYCSVHCSGQ